MNPTSGAFTMPCLSQAGLLGYTPSPQHAFQGDAAHQAQRRTWLTPKDSPGTWYTQRDYRSLWTLHPFHRTVFTAHTWISLPLPRGAHPPPQPHHPGVEQLLCDGSGQEDLRPHGYRALCEPAALGTSPSSWQIGVVDQ